MNMQTRPHLDTVEQDMTAPGNATEFLRLENLRVAFDGTPAVHGVSLSVTKGEALGLVGESGSGKSVTWLATLGLLSGRVAIGGRALLHGQDLLTLRDGQMTRIRGGQIAMIFQDPASALNPLMSIGRQMGEALALHQGLSGRAIRAEAQRLLDSWASPTRGPGCRPIPTNFPAGKASAS